MDYKTIMINIGTENLLGEALITLALYNNMTVFVTVSSDDEVKSLLNTFPKVLQIIIFINNKFYYMKFNRALRIYDNDELEANELVFLH